MQVGPQRHLFLCSIEQTVTEICTFQMGEFPVQISLSVIWTWSSPKVIYKINKLYVRITVYLNDFLILGKILEETVLSNGYCDLPVTEASICYKLKEISSSPNTENGILGDVHRLSGEDGIPASGR